MNEAFSLLDVLQQLVTVLGPLALLWWRLQSQITAGDKALADYKLQVAEKYATNSAIREVEQRVVEAINRLGDRVENYFDSNSNRNRN